jgi:hypothetical protein
MDTRFTDEELAFQAKVRQFFAEVMDDELNAMLHGAEASTGLLRAWRRVRPRLAAVQSRARRR